MQSNTLSLDGFRVERRKIAEKAIVLHLPMPPSTNNLFINIPGRGRVPSTRYKEWKKEALDSLWRQKRASIDFPVSVSLTVPDKGRRDADNFFKPVMDFLVQQNFIKDDSRAHVRELHFKWGQIEDCLVELRRSAA